MGNITDYLKWRGDLTFEQDPFNEVDNLILAQLAYVDLKDFIPSVKTGDKLSLEQVTADYFDLNSEQELDKVKTFIKDVPFFLREVAKYKRFKDIMLSNFVDIVDVSEEKQFSAFHAELGDGSTYISFRGTDDTIVGWKEDFNMSFISPVPSQIEAEKYVNQTVKSTSGKIRMGGHSKGGNLAIYAAVKALPRVKKNILYIYNNDGPGFDSSMIGSPQYQAMLPRVKTIVPEHSVIGMLLEHEEEYMVVKSSQIGVMQHDAMSWQVCGNRFETIPNVSKESAALNKALRDWIDGMSMEARSQFVETLFSIIKSTGFSNLSDLNTDFFKSVGIAVKAFGSMDPKTRWVLTKILHSIAYDFRTKKKNKNTED